MRRAACLVLLLAGCPESLDELDAEALGPEVGDVGPQHRPGQPCLVCHRGDFVVAGTVYENAASTIGEVAVEVTMTDADDRLLLAYTNAAGNFMFSVDESLSEPDIDMEDGWTTLDFQPRFPLEAVLVRGAGAGQEREMRNKIYREGSCAACHTDPAGPTSDGRILLDP